jgi:acetyltransferase
MNLKQQLDYLFNPRSVAVIGASNIFGKWGFNILGRLLSCKCDRQIYAINNKEPEVLGLKAYKSVVDVPGYVDLAGSSGSVRRIPWCCWEEVAGGPGCQNNTKLWQE